MVIFSSILIPVFKSPLISLPTISISTWPRSEEPYLALGPAADSVPRFGNLEGVVGFLPICRYGGLVGNGGQMWLVAPLVWI